MVKYNETMRDIERERAENTLPNIVDKIANMAEGYSKNLNLAVELTAQQKQQQELATGISNTLGQGMLSTFDALTQGSQDFAASLQEIASGVLIEIANQLLRIYVINQAISAISNLLGPKTGGFLPGVKFNPQSFSMPSLLARAAGGPVSAGSPYLVGERGPELFMPRTSGSIYPNDAMGMGGANVIVNVDASGTSAQGNGGQANQLGKVIGAAVQAELIKQRRPGGLLA
jgi:phage-related minor tail protein